MQPQNGSPLDSTNTLTSTSSSASPLTEEDRAIVELDPDHPGFRDAAYRERRNQIAEIAVNYKPGMPIPDAPYTTEEHEVWKTVRAELKPVHEKYACAEYLECELKLGLPFDRIPQMREVTAKVKSISGFRLEPVAGLVLPRIFLESLANGVFLSTQYIRHYSAPLYTPEPDVVHETIGHSTMLANPHIAELTRLVGEAVKRSEADEKLERLGRIYWFTVEFGVVREKDQPKAFGAGLLSSAGELAALPTTEMRSFDLDAMSQQNYDVTQFQPFLFCADSFQSMYETMRNYLLRWN